MGFIITEERKQSDRRAIEKKKRAFEKKRKIEGGGGRGRGRTVVVAASWGRGDKQKDRSVAGNIRVE